MKFAKNIWVFLLLVVFTFTSTGFIIQKYFCSACDIEYKDLTILDIKENPHKHNDCNICSANSDKCYCELNHDFNNYEIDYFSLDNLFFYEKKQEIKPFMIDIFFKYSIYNLFTNRLIPNETIKYQALPPPFKKILNVNSLSVLFSVFIL